LSLAGLRSGIVTRGVRHFVTATAAIAIIAYLFAYSGADDSPTIHSDGYCYYLYLPSWAIYHDLSFDAMARDWFAGTYPEHIALRRWPSSGRWLNPCPIGTATLMAPFFVVGDLLSMWSNLPRDGLSLYYQYAAGFAGIAYLLAGLSILRRILQRHFSDGVTLATLVSITWGTNLFHYGVFDGTFSHIFSFFLVCLWILLVERWWEQPGWTRSVALGSVAALIVLVRHPNAMFVLVLPLYGVSRWRDVRGRIAELWRRRRWLIVAVLTALAGVIPQAVLYRLTTGAWFVNPYRELGGRFAFASPRLFDVLFSTQKGLFFWSPVLLLAVVGAVVAKGWTRGVATSAIVVFLVQLYLTASWSNWQFGGSFGHRAFTDGLGFAALLIAACFDWAASRPHIRRIVALYAATVVCLSVAQMLQYWTGNLPYSDTTWDQYRESFLRFR